LAPEPVPEGIIVFLAANFFQTVFPITHQTERGGERDRPEWSHPMELLIFIAFIGIWALLQVVILPRMGIST
jgi:hypothetical protein